MDGWIRIRGARQHNLKGMDVDLPKGEMVVITGPSGAGKSSLAFDTLFAEGQRRYVESLSPSARQALAQWEKPDVDSIEGLQPAIAVAQLKSAPGPRATVGTASDIQDFLRLLFARVATPHCHQCGQALASHTVQQVVDQVLEQWPGQRLLVMAPLPWQAELDLAEFLAPYRREGFVRVRLDAQVLLLEEPLPQSNTPVQQVALVIDRLAPKPEDRLRLTEAVELAMTHGQGQASLLLADAPAAEPITFSRTPRCPRCAVVYPAAEPRHFSFNSPHGACPECQGLGHREQADMAKVVPDPAKSLAGGAIAPWENRNAPAFRGLLEKIAEHYGFSILEPFQDLAPPHQQVILRGSGAEELEFTYEAGERRHHYKKVFEGVLPSLERRWRQSASPAQREDLARFLTRQECPACQGQRLRLESRHYLLGNLNLPQVSELTLPQALAWVNGLALPPMAAQVAQALRKDIGNRLGFLLGVGLEHLTLGRLMNTLSGGEAQRIRLANHLGAGLSGVLYILDEPTVGLHQRDTHRLLDMLAQLKAAGNSLVVVEHDRDTMARAAYLVEIGPKAGEAGGRLVAAGNPAQLMAQADSSTGQYLAGLRGVSPPATRRPPTKRKLVLHQVTTHNLDIPRLEIPLGLLVCVTGVSGSGKSALVLDTLVPALMQTLALRSLEGLGLEKLTGAEHLERVVHMDQSPIGRTSRSNPATVLGVLSPMRELLAQTQEARARGYTPGRFSFNVEGGRCQACQGEGQRRIAMHFLPDVRVTCEACQGRRYNRETLEIRYRGKNIADMLEMTVDQALNFFQNTPAVRDPLEVLHRVGLDYLRLGQGAPTLSGGEAQRLKIARELTAKETGRTLYILDEPTTGLHYTDVEILLDVLQRLVNAGNSLLVIEHNLDFIQCADQVIDLGPESGPGGGKLVAQGTPEDIAAQAAFSHTGKVLAPFVGKR